jgi:excinuclease ABC subunit C
MRHKVRTRYDDERINTALLELESALALPGAPLRIECYDISTLHGRHSVGSMVVFTNGRPTPAYRRFRVRMDTGESERRRDDGRGAAPPVLGRTRSPTSGSRPVPTS